MKYINFLFIAINALAISCNIEDTNKKKVAINPNNRFKTISVNIDTRDSVMNKYDSLSKLWHESRNSLHEMDSIRQLKSFVSSDFEMDYESSLQYVFQISKELESLDLISDKLGIFTFNYTRYKSAIDAIQTIDNVLEKNKSLTTKQKKEIVIERKRLIKMKQNIFEPIK